MRRRIVFATAVIAAVAGAGIALAQPARPGDIADRWLLESKGRVLCRVTLSSQPGLGGVYKVGIPDDCRHVLPDVTGWKPTPDGLALLDTGGEALARFDRWSASLFVSSSLDPDLQLARAAASAPSRLRGRSR